MIKGVDEESWAIAWHENQSSNYVCHAVVEEGITRDGESLRLEDVSTSAELFRVIYWKMFFKINRYD